MISFPEAYRLTLEHCQPLTAERVELIQAAGRVVAKELPSLVDSPSVDASLKDGYAVRACDVADATPERPVLLKLVGRVAAGGHSSDVVIPGHAIRILTGAKIPPGAESVLSDEFASDDGEYVTAVNDSFAGRNILPRGCDVHTGQVIVRAGTVLGPTVVGLLAAAGHSHVPVVRRPRIALVATGDEVVAPGTSLREGKLYASNLVTLSAWCVHHGWEITTAVVPDSPQKILETLQTMGESHDAIITCGGAWNSDRDLVVGLLEKLGWNEIYHRVKLGPGKAVGFGLRGNKPVFCLPGGPPSNQMAFLQLALPGLFCLAGQPGRGLPIMTARLDRTIHGQIDWTQFIHGLLEEADTLIFRPMKLKSRLQEMAQTQAMLQIPEGVEEIPEGSMVSVQCFPGVCRDLAAMESSL